MSSRQAHSPQNRTPRDPPSSTPRQRSVAPAIDAATVILVRDRSTGGAESPLEIFLVQRHEQLEVAGGRFVFPGGKVDRADCEPLLTERCEGLSDADAAAILRTEAGASAGLGYWVAAIRELFEEAGILLAYEPDGRMVESRSPRYREYRSLLDERSLGFLDLVARQDLTLAARRLQYFAHWITPLWVPRRFSARFFVAPLPAGQEPMHDRSEAVDGVWMTPQEALEKIGDGSILAMFATQTNLRQVGASRTVAELLDAAARRCIEPIMPRRLEVNGEVRLLIPGEPGYEEGE